MKSAHISDGTSPTIIRFGAHLVLTNGRPRGGHQGNLQDLHQYRIRHPV